MTGVRETTRRVVCRSNVRQLGIGVAMYADDHNDILPPSIFTSPAQAWEPEETLTVRRPNVPNGWDGLGLLFSTDYLPASGIFYCPSHNGEHPEARYLDAWAADSGEIISNFQYRGYSTGSQRLSGLQSSGMARALISDGLRTRADYSHRVGANVLRADISVLWFKDTGGTLVAEALPSIENDSQASEKVTSAWDQLDRPQPAEIH